MFGVPATLRLAAAAEIAADDVVLDVGCGIGGPARTLATQFGCQLVGVDTTRELCEVAAELNRRSGLDDLIEIRAGTAVDLPCEDGRVHRRLDPARVGTIRGQGADVRRDAQGAGRGRPAGVLRRARR